MPELLTPGVFIQEVDFGPQPIEGVSTTTAGFVGEAERGPVVGPPTLVTSLADFEREFGGPVTGKHLAYAVRGFFENGGRRAYIARVVGSGSKYSEWSNGSATGLDVQLLAASGAQVTVSSVVGLTIGGSLNFVEKANTANVVTRTVDLVNGATGVVTLSTPLPPGVSPTTHFARISGSNATLKIAARDPGTFGDEIAILVEPRYVNSTAVMATLAADTWVLGDVGFLEPGSPVQFEIGGGTPAREIATIKSIDAANRKVVLKANLTHAYTPGGRLFLVGWRVSVLFRGAVVETFDGLPGAVTNTGKSAAFTKTINDKSSWIRVVDAEMDVQAGEYPSFQLAQAALLASGDDGGAVDENDVIGFAAPRSGLRSLEAMDGISIIAAPGLAVQAVVNELIGQAERRQDRFAVFEAAEKPASGASAKDPLEDVNDVLNQRGLYNSKYAAMYHPWIRVPDPVSKTEILVPPTGHVLGAFARTDIDRGVFKAPANVVLRGVLGFSSDVPDGEQDILNPAGVNVLRRYTGLGNVIWGARTISAEGLWKYVSVRRLFIFLEQSIIRGTRYAVFEPNDLRLWARLHDSVTNFLTTQWRAGALFGAKPEEAFFVKVDETTTTQDDRDNGRVNILVGIAPVKPAEFIVFQIGQAPQSVIVAEQS